MSVLQSKIFQAGVRLTNEELMTLAKAEALLRDQDHDHDLAHRRDQDHDHALADIDAELERRLEARRLAEKEKQSKGTPDATFGGLLIKI